MYDPTKGNAVRSTWTAGILGFICLAGFAFAHDGAHNPTVLARMDNMSDMDHHMGLLVSMTRGDVPFNANSANAALIGLSQASAEIVYLFEPPERDPIDQASPDIWTQFETFTRLANDLEQTTRALSGTIAAPADLGPAMHSVGQACAACHELYLLD
jgi:cytochrome c556